METIFMSSANSKTNEPHKSVIFLFLRQPKITTFIYPSDRE